MPDQRETLVRRMVEEGTSDDDIRATLKAFDVSPLRKPVSAEDFMRPEDIANRDNGTPLALDVLKGFGKRAIGSLVGMGEIASTGIAESAARTAAQAAASVTGRPSPFNPVIRDPALVRVDEALTPTNAAQKVGGYMETAAELAPGAIGLAKAVPSLARGAVSLAKGGAEALARGAVSDTPVLTQVRQAVSRKLLGRLLDGAKASPNAGGRVVPGQAASIEDDIAGMLDELRAPEPPPSVELPPPAALPPGYTPRSAVPEVAPVPPPAAPTGRLVPRKVPTVEDEMAAALADVRQPAPVTVTTPPPAELPPGYTPRTTAPKPVRERMARQAKATLPEKEPTTTLYRVEPKDLGDKGEWLKKALTPSQYEKFVSERGRLFSDDLASLENYGAGADTHNVYKIEVPASQAKAMGRPHPDGFMEYLVPEDVVKGKKLVGPKPTRPVEPPTTQPARRAYFLRSEEDMAAMRAPREAVTPSGSITIDDLPEAWKSRTGQDLFPTTGAEAKEITAALRAEIKDRGMTIGQAIAAVSKNRNISTATRTQIVRSLSGGQ